MIMKLFTTALILAAVNAKPEDPMTRKLKQRAGPKPAAGRISRHGEKPKHARVHGDKPEHGRAHGDKPEHARAHGDKPQRARAGDGGETPLKVARGEEPTLDARGCYDEWIADGYCDLDNNNADCSLDGGDCCPSTCVDSTYTCGVAGYAPFDAGYGTCDTYAVGGWNQDYCDWDFDSCLGLYASSACDECSGCGEFDAGYGTCDTYAVGGWNQDYCLLDFDSCLDQYASDACDECITFDPSSTLVTYVDQGGCGPRGDDANADLSQCFCGSYLASSGPFDNWNVVATVNGCDYYEYKVYACNECIPFDPSSTLVTYVDQGGCGPRGDDANADLSQCPCGSYLASSGPFDNWNVVATVNGCDYYEYKVYACSECM